MRSLQVAPPATLFKISLVHVSGLWQSVKRSCDGGSEISIGIGFSTDGRVAAYQIVLDRECPSPPASKKTPSSSFTIFSTASAAYPTVASDESCIITQPDMMRLTEMVMER